MPSRWEMPPVYIQSGDPETESTPTLHAPGTLGARFTIINTQRQGPGVETSAAGRSKRYQLVKTASDATVAPYAGATAWWADRSAYIVTTSASASSRNDVAGVFARAWEHAGDYMCVQIGGPRVVKFVDASMAALAAGDGVVPSATDSKAQREAAGTAPTYTLMGRVAAPLTVDMAAATALVDLDIPETT